MNRKLDLHWISPKSPHLSSRGEVWFQTSVQIGEVRRANVPCMIHISGLGFMRTLNYLVAESPYRPDTMTQLLGTRSTIELIARRRK